EKETPGGCGGREPPSDAARRFDSTARSRNVYVAAGGTPRVAQGGNDHPRRDESRRRTRGIDAGGATSVAVGRIVALVSDGTGDAETQGSSRSRLLPRSDARRGNHRSLPSRNPELQEPAVQLLSDSDEVSRRGPTALRRVARARVHDEGRILVPPRRGIVPDDVSRDARCVQSDPHAH